MKAILMSIRPKWVVKILNGEKKIEIRKTAPNCELPIDLYIYCTKDEKRPIYLPWEFPFHEEKGAIVADCDFKKGNGKVVAKFRVGQILEIGELEVDWIVNDSCVSKKCIENYRGDGSAYAWFIDVLQIFGEPKELSEFGLKKAPQSWCYVEEKE